LALAALLGAAALSAPAADTPAKKADKGAAADKKKSVTPADAEAVAEALRRGAGAVLLTPEEEQRRTEELARLKARVAELEGQPRARPADRPVKAPGACQLRGKVEGNLARLRAIFDFATEKPDTTVLLGCNQARATGGSFEGRTPQLGQQKAEGLTLLVKSPGTYQLTLELELALETQGADTGFTLSFPPIPIFNIDLELPPGVKDLRVNKRPLAECPFLKRAGERLSGGPGLGNVDRLEINWKNARAAAGTSPLLSADGAIQVRVGRELITEARLTLKVEGGQADRWPLLLPPKAELSIDPADADRLAGIDRADRPFASLRTVRLKGPSSAPLTVHVRAAAPAPRAGAPAAVGPFFVLGAAQQTGTLLLRKAAPELHLTFRPRGDLTRRAPTEEEKRDGGLEAAFNYHFWNVKPPEKPAATGAGSLSWLDVEAEAVRGQLGSRVKHDLALKPAPDETRRLTWYATTTITVTPRGADVDHLEVKLPAGWEDLDEGRTGDPAAARVARLRLSSAGEAGPRSYTLTLSGRYRGPGGPASEGPMALPLPLPQGTHDQGGVVTVQVPADTELLPLPAPAGLEPTRQAAHEQTWQAPVRAPERVEVHWRPYRPDVRVAAVVDLTLGPRQGLLRHEISLQFTQPAPPRELTLRVPAAVADSLRVAQGGALQPGDNTGARVVRLSGPAGPNHRLVLEYAFARPSADRDRLDVPLVVPEGVTQGEVKVRVWAEPGAVPLLADAGWKELPVEADKGHDGLPGLVARAERVAPLLKLAFGQRKHVFTVLVERALIQARVLDAGGQTYRAAFRLEQLAGDTLDVELPAPVPTLGLRVRLDGRGVPWETVDEEGHRSDGGRVARLKLGPLVRPGSVLEVSYQLPPGRAGNNALQTALLPPTLRGGPGHVPTRWQLTVPAGWVTVGPEGGPGSERTWGRRGWLLAPRLALAPADLEEWLTGAGPLPPAPEEGGPAPPPSLACWRTEVGPLTLAHAPQQAWLLACSLGLLVLCLGLYALTRPAEGQGLSGTWFWPALTLAALGVVVAGLLWPTTLGAVVYGCEPGAAVLIMVAIFQWLLHERYRRQVVFLPSFSRGRAGSSLLRGSSAQRPAGEPSTVDAPPRTGSSAAKAESRTLPE
jgi:hypothetical protein